MMPGIMMGAIHVMVPGGELPVGHSGSASLAVGHGVAPAEDAWEAWFLPTHQQQIYFHIPRSSSTTACSASGAAREGSMALPTLRRTRMKSLAA